MMQQEPLVTATVSRRRSARDRVRQRRGLIERLMPLPWELWPAEARLSPPSLLGSAWTARKLTFAILIVIIAVLVTVIV